MENMINLDKFAGGALAERVNEGLKQVLENLADPDTEYKPKRKLTVELTFETSEDRELTEIDIVVKPKLIPKSIVRTKMIIDRDLNGEVLGSEFRKQLPGQTVIKVNSETGEILSEEPVDVKGLQIIK
jgi:hypothetical protein